MIVEVIGGAEERPEVRVVDVDDLTRLHLAVGEVTDEEADAALRDAGLGRVEGDEGILDTAALRRAAESSATAPDWARRWEQMVDAARSKGWTDDGGSLHVHLESAAGA